MPGTAPRALRLIRTTSLAVSCAPPREDSASPSLRLEHPALPIELGVDGARLGLAGATVQLRTASVAPPRVGGALALLPLLRRRRR